MELNADFTARVVVKYDENEWRESPIPGVRRKMLDRIGAEVARATTIVEFAPDAAFSAHTHDGGEEFLVLDGVFSDEHGDFPAGSYIRNPPTSHHTPHTKEGTTILVKLHQMDPADRTHVRTATQKLTGVAAAARPGVTLSPLFDDGAEDVRMEDWAANTAVTLDNPGGMEVFVLSGSFEEGGDQLTARDWLRLPPDARLEAVSGPEGARLWVKSGHLAALL